MRKSDPPSPGGRQAIQQNLFFLISFLPEYHPALQPAYRLSAAQSNQRQQKDASKHGG
ncbi:Uncharacterised protein [Raoultella terrigena]|uniref:Uncharacterized protein n=1 Tax=Raoultella terrigena TaxID=577 RepID=A0A3P8JHI8_RAOTE|nr:Uncharacterised protein [Raoultella terrigena]